MTPRTHMFQARIAFLAAHRYLWENCPPQDRPVALERLARTMKNVGLYSRATKESDIVPGLRRLMEKARLVGPGEARVAAPAMPCSHMNWAVRDYNRMGYGMCLDCNKEVSLAVLFDNLRRQAAEVIARLSKLLPPGEEHRAATAYDGLGTGIAASFQASKTT